MSATGPALVLIGPPGAGKTKLGKRVSAATGLRFTDTDKRIVALHGPISEIFAQHGEQRFREIEREQVALALASDGIVSLGGGAVLDPRTQAELEPLRVALITVSAAAVAPRISGAKRPLLAAGGVGAWETLVEQRRPLYERLATATFDTSDSPMDAVAQRIVAWLEGTD